MQDILISKVIEAIADSEGVEPDDLEIVLNDHINFDAIELLAKHSDSTWKLEFELPNQVVTVTSNGEVLVDYQQEYSVQSSEGEGTASS